MADQLTKEVRAFRLKQSTTTGNLSFKAEREADHDDLVIALALGVSFPHPWGEPRRLTEDRDLREEAAPTRSAS